MRGKRVPDKRRAEAVGLALVAGVPDASRALGIPQRTIRHWKDDPEFAELGLSAREDVATSMWVGIQVGLEELHKGLTSPDEPLKAKSETVAMLIEKRALLLGDPTSRAEVNTFHGHNDHEKRAIAELLRRAVADVTEGTAEGDAEGTAVVGAGTPGADSPTG